MNFRDANAYDVFPDLEGNTPMRVGDSSHPEGEDPSTMSKLPISRIAYIAFAYIASIAYTKLVFSVLEGNIHFFTQATYLTTSVRT